MLSARWLVLRTMRRRAWRWELRFRIAGGGEPEGYYWQSVAHLLSRKVPTALYGATPSWNCWAQHGRRKPAGSGCESAFGGSWTGLIATPGSTSGGHGPA